MLKSLAITNVALIERAEIIFSEGLNVLSGETGAGKSVVLDCIDFVLGAKADRGMIRHGQTECFVRAEFSCDEEKLLQLLQEYDIESDDTLIISRKLNIEGKGAIKINGCAVTSSMLRALTSLLVDVHGQSEHFYLLKESNQLSLLDKIAGQTCKDVKEKVSNLLQQKKQILFSLQQLGGDEGERSRRMDILRYRIEEIERVSPKAKEDEELVAAQNLFQHSEKILEGLSSAKGAFSDDSGRGVLDLLSMAKRFVAMIERYDGKYQSLCERMEECAAELSDIQETIGDYLDELDFDEEERERVENRLDEIKSLKKKYGATVEEIYFYLQKSQEELATLENAGEQRELLVKELEKINIAVFSACQSLTEIRKHTAKLFTKSVTDELKTLNISSAQFEIDFAEYDISDVEKATQTGLDTVKFLFSANAGEPLKEMNKIISGGEMSRFMLAVKAVYAGNVGTCIFDEIDAGIGGKTAWAVAEKFCKIAQNTQVISVSHLAQIAAFASSQFLIEKKEENGKTHTQIIPISGEKRKEEIARILSGESSQTAIKQAEELLEKAKKFQVSLS